MPVGARRVLVSGRDSTPGFSLTAPEDLAFVSATDPDSDNTQALLVTVTAPEIDDEIVFNANLGAFGTANDPAEYDVTDTYVILAADLIDLEGDITLALTPDGEWFIRAFHKRGSTYSLASNTISKTITTADVTAPVLSSPVDTATSSIAGSGSITTDEGNGTLYWVVSTSATPPSAAQVKAGNDHTGSAAVDSGSQAVSGTGVQSITGGFTGLTAATAYYAHYMHEDAEANQSTVSSGDGFTTQTAFSVSYLNSVADNNDQSSAYTIAGASLGAADASRKIAVAFVLPAAAALTVTSVTIGGVAASQVSGAIILATNTRAWIYEAAVPTGTTGDIVINFSGGTAVRLVAGWWRVVSGTSSSGQGVTGSSVTTVAATVTIPTDGVGIYFCYQFTASSFNAWTNLTTEDFDIISETSRAASGGRRTTAGSTSVSANWTGGSYPNLVACAYGP